MSLIHTGTRTCTLNGKARLHTLTEPGLLTESSQDDGDPPPGFLGPLKIRNRYVEKNNVLSKAPPVPNHTHTHIPAGASSAA